MYKKSLVGGSHLRLAAGQVGTPHRFWLGQTGGTSVDGGDDNDEPFAITAPGADINLMRSVESQPGQFTVFISMLLCKISLVVPH
jgi:hypothetical protein